MRTKICASILEKSEKEFLKKVNMVKECDLIEIRIDLIKEPFQLLKKILYSSPFPIILTNRIKKEGGVFEGSEKERISILKESMVFCDFVDIELNSRFRDEIIQKAEELGIKKIISFHDIEKTPDKSEMENIIRKEINCKADIAKLIVNAKSHRDLIDLLEVTRKASSFCKVATASIGEYGKFSRIATSFFGSCLVYGYVDKPTANGQLSIYELVELRNMGLLK